MEFEHENITQLKEMVQGNINRILVSQNIEEIEKMLNYAINRLSRIAYIRIKDIKLRGDKWN